MMTSRVAIVAALALAAACGDGNVSSITPTPSLDEQVRQEISRWGVLPMLPVTAPDPALVDLGRSLFFDKILSGNRDVSCASCHNPATGGGDGLSLAVGTGASVAGGTRTLGAGRQFTPRNAPSVLSASLRPFYLFWDGRVQSFPSGIPVTPLRTAMPLNIDDGLAAQAMIAVLNRVELRGDSGDHDVFGNVNELAVIPDTQYAAVWNALRKRVFAVSAYVQKFQAAYPGRVINDLDFDAAATAIAAFERSAFGLTNSPFDRYLRRDDAALSTDAKRGALLFFGRARCSQCHNGPLLGGQEFANAGVPQLGPGTGAAAPLDIGAGDSAVMPQFVRAAKFAFRVPPLRNVELTAPYMHDGVYTTLEAVVRHYNNVDSALTSFDASPLDPSVRSSYHGDAATIAAVRSTLDGRLVAPLALTPADQRDLVAFLESLTDPAARNLGGLVPSAVPSGLPVTP